MTKNYGKPLVSTSVYEMQTSRGLPNASRAVTSVIGRKVIAVTVFQDSINVPSTPRSTTTSSANIATVSKEVKGKSTKRK